MKVKFVPQNIELETTPEKTLLQLAMDNGIEIKSLCKGVPSCAECRIRVTDGEANIMPPNKAELSLIGTNYYIDSRRLACQVRCFGPVTIDMTEQLERQENNTKKIRGFRSEKPSESIAVLDTMLLTEKPPENLDRDSSRDSGRDSGSESGTGSDEPSGNDQPNEGRKEPRNDQRNKQGNHQRNNQRNNQRSDRKSGQRPQQQQQQQPRREHKADQRPDQRPEPRSEKTDKIK